MDRKNPVIDTNQSIRYGSKQDGYIGTTLPETIEDLCMEEGDNASVELETGSVGDRKLQYLKITKETSELEDLSYAEKREVYKIRYESGSLFIRFPPAIVREDKSPFYDIPVGAKIFVEINQQQNFIGVYTEEMFPLRNQQLGSQNKQPWFKSLLAGLTSLFSNKTGYVDLTRNITSTGQKFRLVPFDARNKVFRNKVYTGSDTYRRPDKQKFQELYQKNKIPRSKPLKLRIDWDPAGLGCIAVDNKQTIYQTYLTAQEKVILPFKGTFGISTKTWRGTDRTHLSHDPSQTFGNDRMTNINAEWEGEFHTSSDTDNFITVYVPCK